MEDLKNKITLVIIGRSGSGKGTQAKFIIKRLKPQGVRHLETGRFLRQLLKKDNPTTRLARDLMAKGGLFPAWFAEFTWFKQFVEKGCADQNLVFDGTPRKEDEAALLDEVLEWHGRSPAWGVCIDVGPEEAFRRLLKRQRPDDTPEAIRSRLEFFETDVLAVINYYQSKNQIITVNGEQSVRRVWKELDQRIAERLGDTWPRS